MGLNDGIDAKVHDGGPGRGGLVVGHSAGGIQWRSRPPSVLPNHYRIVSLAATATSIATLAVPRFTPGSCGQETSKHLD